MKEGHYWDLIIFSYKFSSPCPAFKQFRLQRLYRAELVGHFQDVTPSSFSRVILQFLTVWIDRCLIEVALSNVDQALFTFSDI